MKVYVTGGRGFFGSNLVAVLEQHGDEVVAPPSSEVDLTDARAVALRRLRDAHVLIAEIDALTRGGLR